MDRWAHLRDLHRFEIASREVEDHVRDRLDAHIAVAQITQGLFVASEEVELEEFRQFVDQLDLPHRYPGFQALGYLRRVSSAERAEVEAELRAAGLVGFEIWPATTRDEAYVVVFVEPLDRRNLRVVGYDPSSEPDRRAALERARDSGAPAATGPVTLVQEIDAEKQTGVLVCVPVYADGDRPTTTDERRARLQGFVFAALRMDDLLGDISEEEPTVAFAIADHERAVWTELYRGPRFTEDASLSTRVPLDVAGRTWVLTTAALPTLYLGSSRRYTPYVLVLGVALSVGLALAARFRARTEGELRLHSRVLESVNEGVSVADEAGVILYTNAAEDAMFGYRPGELVGKHVSVEDAHPPAQTRRLVDEVLSTLREKGAWSGEFENVRKDGSTFLTSARITGLEVGGRTSWICVKADITEQRRAEDERAELLERETSLRVAAESASRAKDEFLAMLGHELRNPLAPIVTALELLRRRGGPPLPELAILERQARHLRRLVDDLLDVSRITRGRVVLERARLELAHAVGLAVELATPSLEERGHSLAVDVPPSSLAIDADEARIVQVITEPARQRREVHRAGRTRRRPRACARGRGRSCGSRDDGIGIAPELMPRLFDLFAQGDAGADRARGRARHRPRRSCEEPRRAARRHRPRPQRGRGTRERVRGPPAGAAAPAPEPGRDAGRDRRRRASPGSGSSWSTTTGTPRDRRRAAALRGLRRPTWPTTAPTALDARRRVRSDVASSTSACRSMDGYELARRLPEPRPTLFAVTGYGRPMDHARSASAGFARHFVKPVAAEVLLHALAEPESDQF